MKDDGWVLTPEEEKIAIADARLSKIRRLEYLAKRYNRDVTAAEYELTEDEETAALVKYNRQKFLREELESLKQETRLKKAKEWENLKAKWDYAFFYKTLKSRAYAEGEDVIYNDQTAPIIKAICYRLSGDPKYEYELGFSFRKGLIIRGEPGLGKSWIVGLLADNPVCSVQVITMNEISETVRKTGSFDGVKFGSYSMIYIDDVGTEAQSSTKVYGNEVNWFKNFIEGIYSADKKQLSRVMLSTNCSAQEFEEKYGFRVRDRIAEMFDVLELNGTSLRRK